MKSIILFSLFLVLSAYATEKIEYIKSKDDIIFHTPDMFQFSDVGKISEFRGVIDRVYFTAADMRMIDLYQFKTEAIKIDKELCEEYIEKIFAIKKSKIFDLKYLRIADSNKGKVCEAYVTDKVRPKKEQDAYYRFATVGFVNTKANVLVYHPKGKGIDDNKISEARKFWNSLR